MTLRKIFKNISTLFAKESWDKKSIWLAYDHPERVRREKNRLLFKNVHIEIARGEFEFLLDGFSHLVNLCEKGGFRFSINENRVLAERENLKVEVQTAEELFILSEIFLEHEYRFSRPGRSVVIDVGMNVGFASLYFAARPDVEHVYGFEPFAPTVAQCRHNLSLNPGLSNKITTNAFGLGAEQRSVEVDYDFDNKGQVGIHGIKLINSKIGVPQKERIAIQPVRPEIEKIAVRHPGMGLVCKVDCEGAEYELFSAFAEAGFPEPVKMILMEWHEQGPEDLIAVCKGAGFSVVCTANAAKNVGMIYAVRN